MLKGQNFHNSDNIESPLNFSGENEENAIYMENKEYQNEYLHI